MESPETVFQVRSLLSTPVLDVSDDLAAYLVVTVLDKLTTVQEVLHNTAG